MTRSPLDRVALLSTAPHGVETTRRLILQLAVSGALSERHQREQRPPLIVSSDSLTLGPIRPHLVPETWVWAPLSALGQIVGGGTPSAGESSFWAESGRGIPWVTPADLNGLTRKYVRRGRRDISPSGLANSSAQMLPAGTVLFSSRAPIGYVAIAESEIATNQGFKSCVPGPLVTSEYLYWYLKWCAPLVDATAPGTTFREVSGGAVGKVLVAVPPLQEQHRIVAKVDELMALCDRLEARQQDAEAAHARLVQALLDSLTQARDADEFQACWHRVACQPEAVFTTEASIDDLEHAVLEWAISGRMTQAGSAEDARADLAAVRQERAHYLSPAKLKKHDADASEVYWACPYELPECWAWVSLAAVVLQITDGTHHTPTYVDEGTPFISVKDLNGETVSFEDCRHIPHEEHVAINERCNPERGDILICRIGTLGRPTIVDTDRAFSIFVSVGLLKMPKSVGLSEYLHLVLRSPLAYRQYDRIKAGGSHTNKLNLGDIPKIMVPLPPANERAEILKVVREVSGLCSQLRARIAAARYKHAQLAEALVAQAVAA
jgi:type I restriction enzyme S subunit